MAWQPGAVWLHKPATLKVLLPAWLDQNHGAFLGAIINSAVRQGDRAFRHPAFVGVALVSQDIAGLEIEASKVAAPIAAVAAVQAAIHEHHAAVMILHVSGEPDFVGFDAAISIIAQLHQSATRTVG